MTTDGIDLINKDNAWCLFFTLDKEISHPRSTNPDEHLNKVRSTNGKKWDSGFASDCPRKQGFSSAWSSDEQDALWDAPAQTGEFLGVFEECNDLFQFLLRLFNPSYIIKRHSMLILG